MSKKEIVKYNQNKNIEKEDKSYFNQYLEWFTNKVFYILIGVITISWILAHLGMFSQKITLTIAILTFISMIIVAITRTIITEKSKENDKDV